MSNRLGPCRVSGCANPIFARRFCKKHYVRVWKYGDHTVDRRRSNIGSIAERNIASLLKQSGREVIIQPTGSSFDLLVDGKKVEVKAASPQFKKHNLSWFFNLHHNGKLNECADLYVVCLMDVPFSKSAIYMLYRSPLGCMTLNVSFRKLLMSSEHIRAFSDFKTGIPLSI